MSKVENEWKIPEWKARQFAQMEANNLGHDFTVGGVYLRPDKEPIFSALAFGFAFYVFGISLWKAIVCGILIFVASWCFYGRAKLWRGAIVVLPVSVLFWSGVLPMPSEWPAILHRIIYG